jgi:hypothetical protein
LDKLEAAAFGTIRLGYHESDFVPYGGKSLEGGDGELWRAAEDEIKGHLEIGEFRN